MPTNSQIRKDLSDAILKIAPAMPEMDTLVPKLALEVGWRRETITDIVKNLVDSGQIEIRNGLICAPKSKKHGA